MAVATLSCNKSEETETIKYLEGKVRFNAPDFVAKNTTATMTPSGARHPNGGNVGYYFTVSSLMTKADTTKKPSAQGDGRFTFNFGDSLGTYTVECTAYTEDEYYAITSSMAVTVVDPDNSIIHKHLITDSWYTDPRDNYKYSVTSFGGLDWTKPNLTYKGKDGKTGLPFKNCEIMNTVFGRYYTWEEAQTACPEGWRLPSDEEWTAASQSLTETKLEPFLTWPGVAGDYFTYEQFNSYDLLEFWPNVKVTNKTGFSALTLGFGSNDTDFDGALGFATFWTSSSDPKDSSKGIYRYLASDKEDFFVGSIGKNQFRANVRCVRTSEDQ